MDSIGTSSSNSESENEYSKSLADTPSTADSRVQMPSDAIKTSMAPIPHTTDTKSTQANEDGERCGKSWVWEHFNKVLKPAFEMQNGKRVQVSDKLRAQCKWCKADLSYDTKGANGTSTMGRHIKNVCKKYPGRVKMSDGQQKLASTGCSKSTKDLVMIKWTEQGCREAAVKYMVMDELPFSLIEKSGFKYFCRYAMPDWHVPSRRVIIKQFLNMYESERVKLKKLLKGKCLCLTTDTWASIQNINYMVVTAHFIDSNWEMQKRILSFKIIPNHQGSSIGSMLEDCLLEWGVERVLTISVDNASANKVAINYIRERMLCWEKEPVLGGLFLHVPCLAHIVNLIVRSGLDMMGTSIASIRNAVRYVRSSPQRLTFFKKCMEKEKIESKKICVLDVPTRWNSTYLMLSTALELRKAFDRMSREEGNKYKGYFDENEDIYCDDEVVPEMEPGAENPETMSTNKQKKKRVEPPIKHDWEKAATFVKFLKIFYDVTMRISASTKPTSWKSFHDIVAIKAEIDGLFPKEGMSIESATEKVLRYMAENMKKKYEKYFSTIDDCNQYLLVALVLNSRYKLRNFESICSRWLKMDYVTIKSKSAELKQLLVRLCDFYGSSSTNGDDCDKIAKSKSGESTLSSHDKGFKKFPRSIEPTGIMKDMEEDWERELEDSDDAIVGHEVDRYLLDPIEKPSNSENFDILEWWKVNGDKYKNLAALSKDVLAIQVSTVASESSFSTSRRVIDPFRSSLTPKTVEALICYQNWVFSESIDNIQNVPTIEDMEFYEDVEKEKEKEEVDKPSTASTKTSKGKVDTSVHEMHSKKNQNIKNKEWQAANHQQLGNNNWEATSELLNFDGVFGLLSSSRNEF